MKTKIIWLILLIICTSLVSAVDFEVNFTTTNYYLSSDYTASYLQLKSLKYEPYPVNPGEYFTLWIKAENMGKLTQNATFELIPKYPFSLDSNEDSIKVYGKLTSEEPVVMEYKVRVDKDAVEGSNKIEMKYSIDGDESYWIYKEFEIEIDDAQTDFDLVIQEVNEEEFSIAIANTGKNVAYSVIVRIPEQESFQTTGTNGQMVGNLEDGDYTLVGFDISRKRSADEKNLKVQIDYTDEIGERRSVVKEIDYNAEETNGFAAGVEIPEGMTQEEFRASRRNNMMQTQTAIYQKWWFWAIIIAVLYAGWKGFKFYKIKKEEKEERNHKKR